MCGAVSCVWCGELCVLHCGGGSLATILSHPLFQCSSGSGSRSGVARVGRAQGWRGCHYLAWWYGNLGLCAVAVCYVNTKIDQRTSNANINQQTERNAYAGLPKHSPANICAGDYAGATTTCINCSFQKIRIHMHTHTHTHTHTHWQIHMQTSEYLLNV